MEITKNCERIRHMDVDTYFDKVYASTSNELLKIVIVRTNNAHQVEDILQNVYKNFYIRITKRGFADIKQPHAFLMKLTQKELSRHYKNKAEKNQRETEYDDVVADNQSIDFEAVYDNKVCIEEIQQIVKKLPLTTYKAFMLYYAFDMPVSIVASRLNISEDNVKTRLFRARNAVKKELSHE